MAAEVRFNAVAGVTLVAAALVACAKAAAPPAPAAPPPQAASEVSRYLPLQDATVFAYDTTSGGSEQKGLLVLEIRRRRPSMAELIVAGRTRRVEIDATGIRHATGGYLLKAPLSLHAKYPGDFGSGSRPPRRSTSRSSRTCSSRTRTRRRRSPATAAGCSTRR